MSESLDTELRKAIKNALLYLGFHKSWEGEKWHVNYRKMIE